VLSVAITDKDEEELCCTTVAATKEEHHPLASQPMSLPTRTSNVPPVPRMRRGTTFPPREAFSL
jgi:hypothetical protein